MRCLPKVHEVLMKTLGMDFKVFLYQCKLLILFSANLLLCSQVRTVTCYRRLPGGQAPPPPRPQADDSRRPHLGGCTTGLIPLPLVGSEAGIPAPGSCTTHLTT